MESKLFISQTDFDSFKKACDDITPKIEVKNYDEITGAASIEYNQETDLFYLGRFLQMNKQFKMLNDA